MTVLRGDRVTLRPLRLDELDELMAARQRQDGMPQLWEAGARERLERNIASSGRYSAGRLDFAIEAESRLIGTLDARHAEAFVPPGVSSAQPPWPCLGPSCSRRAPRRPPTGRPSTPVIRPGC